MTSPHSENQMFSVLRQRRATIADDRGFTLIELFVVVFIIGVLLAIAVPAYLHFENAAQSTVAAADVREAITDATAYYGDHNNYSGMSPSSLRATYDSGLVIASGDTPGIESAKPEGAGGSFCISAVDSNHWAHYNGPNGTVVTDPSSVTSDPCP